MMLFFREEEPAEKIGDDADSAAEHQHEPDDSDDERINIKIFSDATAYASQFLVTC